MVDGPASRICIRVKFAASKRQHVLWAEILGCNVNERECAMNKSFSERIRLIKSRRNPDNRIAVANSRRGFTFDEAARTTDDLHEFILEAMCEVDDSYTKRTKDAGNKVKDILEKSVACEFRYQGSVMTDTHIKGASDIDLLCLGQRCANEAWGPSRERMLCLQKLDGLVYSVVSGAKSLQVKLSATSVKVDVVNGTWNTAYYPENGRMVRIYNAISQSMEKGDYPFISINSINKRSADTQGRLKRMIRFLKNLKEDADAPIKLSSFEINAICYDVDPGLYHACSYIQLVDVITRQIWNKFIANGASPQTIKSVTGEDYPFSDKPSSIVEVKKLYNDLFPIWNTLHNAKEI